MWCRVLCRGCERVPPSPCTFRNEKIIEISINGGKSKPHGFSFFTAVKISTTKWTISYYSDDDKENAEAFFKKNGIEKDLVSYVKLDDLLLVKQGVLEFEG